VEEGNQTTLDYKESIETGEWREWDLSVLMLGGYPKKEQKSNEATGSADAFATDEWYGMVVTPVENKEGEGNRMKRVGWLNLKGEEAAKVRDDQEGWRTITLV
jgi:hypothetical protein